MDSYVTFLWALNQPEYSRTEYFIKQQKESGYSPEVFFKLMTDAHDHFVAKIKTSFSRPDVSGLALRNETNFQIGGHLFLSDLEKLKKNIEDAQAIMNEPEKKSDKANKTDPKLTLFELFNHVSEYQNIMAILADKELIDINTNKAKTGRGTKGIRETLSGVIKDLYPKGYLKRRPANDEIKIMLLNTFQLDVSIDTVKHCNTDIIKIPYITQNTRV